MLRPMVVFRGIILRGMRGTVANATVIVGKTGIQMDGRFYRSIKVIQCLVLKGFNCGERRQYVRPRQPFIR
jgi:hypothetical protein